MPDILVKLYTLPPLDVSRPQAAGIDIRRALVPEKHIVTDWVRHEFSPGWASEAEICFSRQPVSCFVAVRDAALLGFASYEATTRNFFGPIGVAESERGHGTGAALFMACMHAMRAEGYGYAIIGAAGPVDFYLRLVDGFVIEESWPGVYRGLLRGKKTDG